MIPAVRKRLTYSNVIASLALFVALGGVAVAATQLPRKSVGAKQLKRGAVTTAALRKQAVTSGKLAPKSVIGGKLAPNAVGPGNIGNGAITSAKLAKNAVTNAAIANGVVGTNKLGNEVVTTVKLAKGSVTLAKLSDEVTPLLGTLRSGQTLRGTFDVGAEAGAAGALARTGASYQFPLTSTPAATVLQPGETSANCGGLGGGGNQTPQATPGNLCIYITSKENLDAATPLTAENNIRLGFGLAAKSEAAGNFFAFGQWAVTAP